MRLISKIDSLLSSPNRITYLCNIVAIVCLLWAIWRGSLSMIAIYGLLVFVLNYPWIKRKYRWYKMLYWDRSGI